jgi:toxin ParE1/3/4
LRCWQIKGYPHRVFHIERKDYVDIWRVLQGSRDIPVWLQPAEEGE